MLMALMSIIARQAFIARPAVAVGIQYFAGRIHTCPTLNLQQLEPESISSIQPEVIALEGRASPDLPLAKGEIIFLMCLKVGVI